MQQVVLKFTAAAAPGLTKDVHSFSASELESLSYRGVAYFEVLRIRTSFVVAGFKLDSESLERSTDFSSSNKVWHICQMMIDDHY